MTCRSAAAPRVETERLVLRAWEDRDLDAYLPEIMPAVEIGWRLARAEWGRGYAIEAAIAARDFAFAPAGLDRPVSVAHSDNQASTGVMRKLGMSFERATTHPERGVPVVVYELARSG